MTIEVLREMFVYNPETGELFRRVNSRARPNMLVPSGSLSGTGYLTAWVKTANVTVHRIAWALTHGAWPMEIVDHINGVKTDNRIANLRLVTPAQSLHNVSQTNDSTSGHRGVVWDPKAQKWCAQAEHEGRRFYFGRYARLEDAVAARHAGAVKLHSHSRLHQEKA